MIVWTTFELNVFDKPDNSQHELSRAREFVSSAWERTLPIGQF